MNAFLTSCVGGFVGALIALLLVQAILHYRKVKKDNLPTGEDQKPEVPTGEDQKPEVPAGEDQKPEVPAEETKADEESKSDKQ